MKLKLWIIEKFTQAIVSLSGFFDFILHSKSLIVLFLPALIVVAAALMVSKIIGKLKR